ncbi:hypothetical protein CDD83_72 [Cordyceps sp. RAO-2017]|nr:hypothetical protein CDD83_72 [Cordyceps sp. RAO-2017]
MSSKAVATAAGGVVSIAKKQTLQSQGIWERFRRAFALDPNRSNGVPLNPWYRNPPPGANEPLAYDDPVTTPAGDIADNAYWRRDVRRATPRPSLVGQADVVELLTVGSAARPLGELVGEAGERRLVAARQEGETGLARCLAKEPDSVATQVLVDGMPPLPSGQCLVSGKWGVYEYKRAEEDSYPEE